MRYIHKITGIIFVFALFFTSCDPDKGNDTDYLENRETNIFFNTSTATLFVEEGAANTYSISVGATAPAESNITYEISVDPASTAIEGTDFTISDANYSFAQGNIVTTFTITADFENAITDGKIAVFNLTSSQEGVSVKGISQFVLNIVKLCPFEGLGTTNYGAEVFAFDEEAPSHNVTLVPVAGTTNQWTVSSTWGPTFVSWATGDSQYNGLFLYSATLILNSDFTVTVDGDASWATGGSGLFSPCTQVFTFTLNQGLFNSSFTTDVILTPM